MEFIKYLEKEWGVVSQAPFTFIVLMLLAAIASYFLLRIRYQGTIDTLRERLHHKTEQTESYKERALKYDEKVQQVVDSDATALREKTLDVVKNLREFIERYKREDDRNMMERRSNSSQSEEERQTNWEVQTNNMMRLSSERNAEYDRRFRVDTMMLRDELRSRLPHYEPSERHHDMMYEHPTNYFGFNDVASDLERMAKMLTSQASGTPQSGAPS